MLRTALVGAASLQILSCGSAWEPPEVRLDGTSEAVRQRVSEAVEEARSGDLEATTALGDLYFALGYPSAAARGYERAAKLTQAAEAHLLAGLARLNSGDREAARSHFEHALRVDANHKTARLRIAALDLEAGDPAAARTTYESLLEDYPDDPRVSHGLARAALASGDGATAVRWFQRTLALRPHADRVRSGLAEAYRSMGRHDLAREEQSQAGSGELLSNDPAMARVGRLRLELTTDTVLSLAAGGDASAEEVAGFAVAQLGIVPGAHNGLAARANEISGAAARARFWFSVGALAERQADPTAAVSAYQQAVDAAPNHTPSHLRLARALMKLERFDEAEVALIESGADDGSVVRDLALIARRRGDLEAAARMLGTAIGADGGTERSELLLDLAETRQDQGRIDEAMAAYRRITHDDDPMVAATAWSRIAAEQQRRGDDTAAAASFARAVEASPEWLAPRYGLAATLGRLGRYDDASKAYREILDLQPNEEEAWLGATTAAVFGEASPEAVRRFLERGLRVLPKSRPLRAALARHLVVHGGNDPAMAARALQLAEGLVEEDASPVNRETLAMALAASQQFEDAVKLQQELLTTARTADRSRLERNLELYRAGRPCCR